MQEKKGFESFSKGSEESAQPRRPAQTQYPAGKAPTPARPVTPQRRPAPQSPRGVRKPSGKVAELQISNHWFRAILMVFATLALCVFLATFALKSASDLLGLNQEDKQIEVVIPKNTSNDGVVKILHDLGVVDQPFTFNVYAKTQKVEENAFQPGTYIFNSNMGYEELMIALRNGNIKKEEVRITFYEGITAYEIARLLEENRVCEANEFLAYLEDADLNYEFMNMLPSNALRFRRLEGYLFPDTYDFFVGEKVASVAKKFLDNFANKVTDEMQAQMMNRNLSLDEVITLASIIQKEAGEEKEMRQVASVFLNRMDLPSVYPKLQSDVTIFYVERYIKPFQTRTDQDMYDAYNTYVTNGLPVGPICNPGLEAIRSVLSPEKTGYYFFVTDDEGTYYYAETAEEHYKKVAIASQVGGKDTHGTDTKN